MCNFQVKHMGPAINHAAHFSPKLWDVPPRQLAQPANKPNWMTGHMNMAYWRTKSAPLDIDKGVAHWRSSSRFISCIFLLSPVQKQSLQSLGVLSQQTSNLCGSNGSASKQRRDGRSAMSDSQSK